MEKKTIGAFISALRRAAGMTQRELGEHLFVSDKTVSRWERDECTPDLALIPVIADLFGVTADELLRGERNGAACASDAERVPSEATPYQKAKSERQFSLLLKRRMVQYRNRTMISVGIALLGGIVAAIINLGFLRAQIAFWASMCFFVAAFICQRCFHVSSHFEPDDEQELSETQTESVYRFNERCIILAQRVRMLGVCLVAFCLPLLLLTERAYAGLSFDSWMLYGAGCAAVAFTVGYSVWELIGRQQLVRRGTLVMSEGQAACYAAERRLLGRSLTVLLAVGAVVLIASVVVQSLDVTRFAAHRTFDTQADFISFAEAEDPDGTLIGRDWFTDVYEMPVQQAPSEEVAPPETDDSGYERRPFYGRDGELVFTYVDRRGISRIHLSDSEDGFPVKVYTDSQIRAGYNAKNQTVTAITLVYGEFGAVVVAVYVKKLLNLRKKYRA